MGPFKIGWDTSLRKDRYRRGMYVFWKRTILYPSLKTFDAPTRAVCTTQRSNTNTPMQALVALNDPVFIEGAVALAQRVLCDKHSRTFRNRLSRAFRLVLGRLPEKAEQDRFHAFYEQQLKHFEQHTKSVADFVRMANELNQAWNPRSSSSKKLLKSVSPAEFAAWSMIASTLLNLDEAITRE